MRQLKILRYSVVSEYPVKKPPAFDVTAGDLHYTYLFILFWNVLCFRLPGVSIPLSAGDFIFTNFYESVPSRCGNRCNEWLRPCIFLKSLEILCKNSLVYRAKCHRRNSSTQDTQQAWSICRIHSAIHIFRHINRPIQLPPRPRNTCSGTCHRLHASYSKFRQCTFDIVQLFLHIVCSIEAPATSNIIKLTIVIMKAVFLNIFVFLRSLSS